MSSQPNCVAYEGQAWDLGRPFVFRRIYCCPGSCQCPEQRCSSQHGQGFNRPMPHALLSFTGESQSNQA